MWEQLTPADIERVKQRLLRQRDEMLRQHAEELRGLDAEQAELETLEQLVLAFTTKHIAASTRGVGEQLRAGATGRSEP